METINDYLEAHAHSKADDEAFTFIGDNDEKSLICFADLHRRAQSIAQYLVTQCEPETKVVLLFPQGLEYVQAFLGCLYAGVVAVPLYPPSSEKHAGRVLTVIDDCKAKLVLTSNALKPKLEVALSPLPVVGFEQIIEPVPDSLKTPPTADQIAFLQYTSGSTGSPKGVMVSHGNIVANLKSLEEATHCSQEDVFCNWLPLFHDLGLVNTLLLPIYLGAHSILMSPVRFIKRPLAWLEAITEYKASICGAPNFAFDHCIERIPPHKLAGIDLSSLSIAFNAAEPVDAETMLRFSDRFSRVGFKESALYPAYGMAEATVFISGGSGSKSYLAQSFSSDALQKGQAKSSEDFDGEQILVAHGHAHTDHHLKIVSPATMTELPDGQVGEIWFAGPSVAQGYWNDTEKTKTSFGARLDNDPNAYLRTGDLGFIHQNELYISGRIKDVIIIKGRNYYPQDFEKLAYNAYTGLMQNAAAAIDANGRAVLLLEVKRNALKQFDYKLACETIQAAIFEQFEVLIEDIVFLKPRRLDKTSSGKVQRSLAKQKYLSGDLDCLYSLIEGQSAEDIQQQPEQSATEVSQLEAELCALWQDVFGLERIGVEDNFLNLGGHSLLAASLISQIQKKWNVDISIRDLFIAKTVRNLANIIENSSTAQLPEILPVSTGGSALTSFAQERLWLVHQIELNRAQYNLPFSLKLYGDLDKTYLLDAFKSILMRHQVLRTTYQEKDGQVFQKIHESFKFDIPVIDLTQLSTVEQEQSVTKLTQEEASKLFDLSQDLMLRVKLLKLNPQSHILLLTVHHIAADGWSLGILTKELNALYAAYIHGVENPLAPLNIQYSDYAYWQRDWLETGELQKNLNYWTEHLNNLPVIHSIPLDRSRPSVQSFRGKAVYHFLNEDLVDGLHNLARKNDATFFMLLNAAFASFLSRYSGESDIVIGSPIANREQAELAPLIGFFINTLIFRTDLSADPSFLDLLEQSKQRTFAAYEHQKMPFEKLVDELQPERSLSHSPLFQIMLILQNQEMGSLNLPGLEAKRLQAEATAAQYDLTLSFHEVDNGLEMVWEYATDLFSKSTIERMIGHFEVLLQGIIRSPETRISQLALLNHEESTQLIENWNDTASAYPQDKCIHELFEEQVERNPNAVAAVFNKKELSYAELNQRANQLARYLASQGVTPDAVVGICVERSLEMLVGVLAIMKSGGAYLPLDPSYPKARLEYMIEDSGVQWVITQKHLAEQCSVDQVFCLDDESFGDELVKLDPSNLSKDSLGLSSNHLSYLIYTSGSTGKPKGVMLEHHNLTNFLSAMQVAPGMSKDDTLLAVTSLSFDIHALELYLPLLAGGQVVIASSEAVLSPDGLASLIDDHRVTSMQATPATWKMLVNNNWEPQQQLKVLCGGEALSKDLKDELLKRDAIELWNMYGPTETAVWSATQKIEGVVSLGAPIANTQFYVLDPHLNPVPIGVAGELHIGGEGVARGYLNQPDLTAEKFIQNPFVEHGDNRIYKTGDLVRWLADGTLEYLRRVDLQVKVRGHRIELEEIETGLKQHPDVEDVVAHVWVEGENSNLVAYITGIMSETEQEFQQKLTNYLETFLPGYMIPSAYIRLEKLPLTPNGKINRSALPKPEFKDESDYVPPQTKTEKKLCQIWQQLLNVEAEQEQWISVTSNFFHLGGHSLLAARLVSEIRKQWNVEVPIRTLFTEQTVRKLAQVIEHASISQIPEIVPLSSSDTKPLSFAQQRLWLIEEIERGSNQYNLCQAFQLSGTLDVDAMVSAFQSIIERHHVLRTSIQTTPTGEAIQVVSPSWDFSLPVQDLTDLTEVDQEQAVLRYIEEETSKLFDLSADLMLRAKLLKCHSGSHVLLVTMHHIAVDGWSVSIIFDEFNRLYRSPGLQLPDLAIHYADYAHWQNNWLQGPVLEHHLQFWKDQLQNLPEVHNLALDHPRPPVQNYQGAHYHQILSSDIQHGLDALARDHDATLFMVLQTAFAILLARHSNNRGGGSDSEDIVIGTPVANRDMAELSPLVGFFVNSVVLRTNLSGNPRFVDLLQSNKEYLLDAYEHTQLPFEKLVDELRQERNLAYSPLFQVKLALQNNEQGELDLPDLSCERIEQSHSSALHDLSLDIFELKNEGNSEGLKLDWEYASALFEGPTIERMAKHFEVLLKEIIDRPQVTVSDLDVLTSTEVEQLLAWSKWPSITDDSTSLNISVHKDASVLDLFERQVAANPDHDAVMFDGSPNASERLTYGELNDKANQVAHYLIEHGVTPDTLVGLCVERSLEMIIGIWGILKAGGAYVPIDPDYPEKHVEHILEDSGIEIVLTSTDLLPELPFDDLQILPLDDEMWEGFLGGYPQENIDRQKPGLCLNNLAYVIYTSGSTGLPKGVAVEHGSLIQSTLSRFDVYQESPGSFALFSSFAFDSSIVGIFWSLTSGGKLCIVDVKQGVDLRSFQSLMTEEAVSHFLTLPSVYQSMLTADLQPGSSLKTVIVAGEACDQNLVRQHQRHPLWSKCRLINEYGPTEACVWSSFYDCNEHTDGAIPIGTTVPHAELYILDSELQICPLGVTGELYVGGQGLARGYHNASELTNQKFIPSPFHKGQRLYKTGDLVRCLPNEHDLPGNLEFLGRLDHQIKIRGFRIELGEVEAEITKYKHVSEAAVIAKTINASQSSKQLVAYVVPDKKDNDEAFNEAIFRESLQSYLIKSLLNHKIPSIFVILEELPHTPNGKVDREALQAREVSSQLTHQYVAPETDIEKQLCEIWQDLLKLNKVGITENFFAIGGDSVLAIQAVARAAKVGLVFTTRQVFECQTVEKLAPEVSLESKVSAPQTSISGEQILIPIQREFASTDLVDQHHYNQSVLLTLPEGFSLDALQKIILALYQRHDVLRLSYNDAGAKYVPLTDQLVERAIQSKDLGHLEGAAWESALEELGAEAKSGLSLTNGDVFRAVLFEGKPDQRRLLLTLHHMVVDGVSWRILLQDMVVAFEQWRQQETVSLPPKTSSFQHWGQYLLDYSNSEAFQAERDYWLAQGMEQANGLPVDQCGIDDNRIIVSETIAFKLTKTKTQALLNDCAAAYRTQINDLLLSALYLALHQWTSQTVFRIDLESHGREHLAETLDLTQTVGWFTSVFPVTLGLDSADLISDVIKTVKEQLRRVPCNGIGFGLFQHMIEDDANEQTKARASEILFNYLGQFDQVINKDSPFQEAFESVGEDVSLQRQRSHMLELNGMVTGGQLGFSLRFNGLQFAQETMESLAQGIESALHQIIDHCQGSEAGGVTPSDFPLSRASQTQLDEWYQTYPNVEKVYPTTGMQQGLLFHSSLDSSAYLTQLSVDMEGSLDSIAMQQAWNEVVKRHDVFRTVFSEDHTHQLVLSDASLPFTVIDWSECKESERQQRLTRFLKEDRAQGFDFKQAPLMRITLITLSQQRHCLIWTNHHALSDGWSLPLIFKEVISLYEVATHGVGIERLGDPISRPPSVLPKAQPYEKYIAWLQQQDDEQARAYWREILANIESPTQIHVERTGDSRNQGTKSQILALTQEKSAQLQSLAKYHNITLNTLIQAAWAYLLHRYSGDEHVVFGETVSGRPAEINGVEDMVGIFINSLPVKVNIEPEHEIGTWLQTLHQASIDRVEYGFLPLSEIQNLSPASNNEGQERNLFDTLVIFENYPIEHELEKTVVNSELSITSINSDIQTTYGLTLTVLPESADQNVILNFKMLYQAERFEARTVTRILEHLELILTGMLDDTCKTVSELPILAAEEESLLLSDWNNTASDYPKDACIHQLFADQVLINPDKVAVVHAQSSELAGEANSKQLTHQELYDNSHALALYLQSKGVKPDSLVGLCVERSLEMMVGILGVLQAGGAYVPMDPEYPDDRLVYMLDDSEAAIIITQRCFEDKVKALVKEHTHVIVLDDAGCLPADCAAESAPGSITLNEEVKPDNLAYVIYTSGSTGQPKGVMIEHRMVVDYCYSVVAKMDLHLCETFAAVSTFSSDLGNIALYVPMLFSKTLYLFSNEYVNNPIELHNYMDSHTIDCMKITPSHFEMFKTSDTKIISPEKVLIFAGEPLTKDIVDSVNTLNPGCKVFNNYGPTETTVSKLSTSELDSKELSRIVLGKPLNNTQIYILDGQNRPQPIGVPGELHIAGDGVGRGYFNRPELTEEKFIPNPFVVMKNDAGKRMYKTGDLARWLEDGNIEFLGRIDTQVKIRGYRIETSEIESRLDQHPAVRNSVVVVQGQDTGKQLIAFYSAANRGKGHNEELKQYLLEALPEYMLPAAFVCLETIPLMPNGKVNRRALESMDVTLESSETYVAPRNEMEKQLVAIWAEVLELEPEKIGINDSFFELGGHSLLAIQLFLKIRGLEGVDLQMKVLMEQNTIAGLAQLITEAEKSKIPPILPVNRAELDLTNGHQLPLSSVQERMWFIDKLQPGSPDYNVAGAFTISGELEIERLEQAFNLIIARHENLRTIFPSQGGKPQQLILDHIDFKLERIDLSRIETSNARHEKAQQLCQADVAKPFDLAKGPLVRGQIIKLSAHEHILMINMHHIITDAWSQRVLIKEIGLIIDRLEQGENPDLAPLPIQYLDYSIWQRKLLKEGGGLQQQLNYWQQKLTGVAECLDLATDYPRPSIQDSSGAVGSVFVLDTELTNQLKSLAEEQGTTLYMTLLAAFKVLLFRYTGQEDICLGSPIANRQYEETKDLIGMFVNTIALRDLVEADASFNTLLKQVKRTCLDAYEHQATPFEKVVDLVQPQRDMSISALFQIMFILHNEMMELAEKNIQLYPLENNFCRFDQIIHFTETSAGLEGFIAYRTALYKPETIERIGKHFIALCKAIVANPATRISDYQFIDETERQQLLVDYNETQAEYPRDKCVHQLFNDQVALNSGKTALVQVGPDDVGSMRLSYQQLYDKSHELALYLQSLGVQPDSLVGLCVGRSNEMMIGLLGILQAGGAYVPLDPDYPDDRLAYMLEDSQVTIILTIDEFKDKLSALVKQNTQIIVLDQRDGFAPDFTNDAKSRELKLRNEVKADNLAYVIYTSGSTGKPKGVMVEHRMVVDYCYSVSKKMDLHQCETFAAVSSFSSDLGNIALFVPIMFSKTLYLFTNEYVNHPIRLKNYLDNHPIDCMKITPSHFDMFKISDSDIVASSKVLIFAGEPLTKKIVETVNTLNPDCKVYNNYGPTETTISKLSTSELVSTEIATICLGKPLNNTQIYILDANHQPQPIGVPGELHIAGDGVARGYLNRPELTEEKFIPNPFNPGTRMYKSGDLARWLDDGNIESLGRIDTQVKIRGFRIEPSEIEAQLNRYPGIKDSVVVAQGRGATKQLIAFYATANPAECQAGKNITNDDLKEHLQKTLPEYMLPAVLVSLEAIPLMPNGKVDRRALENMDVSLESSQAYLAPRNEIEKKLVELWAEVLELEPEKIGINDNFFELGGHSLLAVMLASKAVEHEIYIEVSDMFNYPSIQALMENCEVESDREIIREEGILEDGVALSPIQSYFFNRVQTDIHHFNQSVLLNLNTSLSEDVLRELVAELAIQHDALRLRYAKTDNGWQQFYLGSDAVTSELLGVHSYDIASLDENQVPVHVEDICNQWQASLDIEDGPVMRWVYFNAKGKGRDQLAIIIHHLMIDSVSWRILLEDLNQLIEQQLANKQLELSQKRSSYRDWVNSLEIYKESEEGQQDLAFWIEQSNTAQHIDNPFDTKAYRNQDILSTRVQLSKANTKKLLKRCHRAYGTDINDLLLTAVMLSYYSATGNTELIIEMEGHGRDPIDPAIDISKTVGWFTSIFPVSFRLSNPEDIGQCIKDTKTALHAIPNKGVGFSIFYHLNQIEEIRRFNTPQVKFNYLGEVGSSKGEPTGKHVEFNQNSSGSNHSQNTEIDRLVTINGLTESGKLSFRFNYPEEWQGQKVSHWQTHFVSALEALVDHCCDSSRVGFTPDDFPLLDLLPMQLETITRDLEEQHAIKLNQIQDIYPLTPLQSGILFETLYARTKENKGMYLQQVAYGVSGQADIEALQQAWQLVVNHYDSLRTIVIMTDVANVPTNLQVVLEQADIKVNAINWSDKNHKELKNSCVQWMEKSKRSGISLDRAPLMRVSVLQGSESFFVSYELHHVVTDGWSKNIILSNVFKLYHALVQQQHYQLPPTAPYSAHVQALLSRDEEKERIFWKKYLTHHEEKTPLPMCELGAHRKDVMGYFKTSTFSLSRESSMQLDQLVKKNGLTMNIALQFIWGLLLHLNSGNKTITFGSVSSGRTGLLGSKHGDQMVGACINTIPSSIRFDTDLSLIEQLKRMHKIESEKLDYEKTPLIFIQELIDVETNRDFFQTLFVFQSYPVDEESATSSLLIDRIEDATPNYPLALSVFHGETIDIGFEFDRHFYNDETVTALMGQYERLTEQLIASSESTLRDVSLISAEEKQQLLVDYNDTQAEYPRDKCVHQLFNDQVALNSGKTALVQVGPDDIGSIRLSYQQLHDKSSELALYLQSLGVKPDSLVGLCAGRSNEMMVGLLGILQAGGAYVPLDPDLPEDRLAYMLEDSQAAIVLTLEAFKDKLSALVQPNTQIIVLDQQDGFAPDFISNLKSKELKLRNDAKPDNLAYVIYTSGSTGQPKGVMVEHRMVVDYCYSVSKRMDLHQCETFAAVSTFSADLGNIALFFPIMFSKILYLFSNEYVNHPIRLKNYFDNHPIDCMKITPSHFEMFKISDSEIVASSKVLIFAGEPLTKKIVETVNTLNPGCKVYNNYGPTETTISKLSTSALVSTEIATICLGKPLNNTQIYILDANNQPQPIGVPGELHIAGDGVARGYLNRAELTEEKFIPNPFNPGTRMYKSGDLARWLDDGNIEYLGRIDTQVKIRGFRIELGEIEAQLNQHPEIKDSVIIVQGAEPNKKLVAFYTLVNTGDDRFEKDDDFNQVLEEHLQQVLPEYMLPTAFVSLEAIPLTLNGKVDRRTLEQVDVDIESNQTYLAARNDMERQLVDICAVVLNLDPEKIGVNDNFFKLGGNSLTAVTFVSKIHSQLGLDLPLYTLFELPTISGVAEVLGVTQNQLEELQDDDLEQVGYEEGTI